MFDDDSSYRQLASSPQAGDDKLFVQFYVNARMSQSKTEQEGRPIYEDVPFVKIMVPGDKDNIIDQPAWVDTRHPMAHNNRFPKQWAIFQNNQKDEQVVGMPLDQWAGITRGQAEELKYFKIRTVEQLANVSDGNMQKMGPGVLALRQKALLYVNKAKEDAPLEKVRYELEKRDGEMELMKQIIAEQTKRIEQLAAATTVAVPQSALMSVKK